MSIIIRTARALEAVISKIEKIFADIGVFLLLALMFLGAADVIGRYVFNNPVFGAIQVQQIMMGLIIFLGWAYTLAKGQHMALDIFFYRYPPRAQAIFKFIALFLSLVLFGLIAWRAGLLAMMDWHKGQIVRDLEIIVAPFKLCVVLGAFLLCLECIIQMVHLFPKLSGRKES